MLFDAYNNFLILSRVQTLFDQSKFGSENIFLYFDGIST